MYEITPIEGPIHTGFPLTDPVVVDLVRGLFADSVVPWPDRFWTLAKQGACGWLLACDPPGYVPAAQLRGFATFHAVAADAHHRAVWAYLAALPGDTPVVLRRVSSDG